MPNDPKLAAAEMRRLTQARRTSLDPWWFTFDGTVLTPDEVVVALSGHMSEERTARIEDVLDQRTMSLAVVVEGTVDSGNIAAMMRTAEAFGVQSFHTVDTARSYKHSRRASRGAEKWLDRWRWTSAPDCAAELRRQGFRIVAAHVDAAADPIGEVDFSGPTALVLGNELEGVSDEMLALVDATAMVPMSGFVESLNVSVATALCLDAARRHRFGGQEAHGDLDDRSRSRLRAVWYQKSVPHARDIIRRRLQDRAAR